MSLLAFLMVGLAMGAIARAVAAPSERMTFLSTAALGIAGALVGGVLSAWAFTRTDLSGLHPITVVYSVLGALLVLVFVSLFGRRLHWHA